MFGKVKKILGIEGAKIELVIPEKVTITDGVINGTIFLQTINSTKIYSVEITLIEVYSRGRGKTKRTDEYQLGRVVLDDEISILKNQKVEVSFELPFTVKSSAIDDFARKNIFASGIASLAKLAKGANSRYYIQAIATEDGTRLNPKNKKEIKLI